MRYYLMNAETFYSVSAIDSVFGKRKFFPGRLIFSRIGRIAFFSISMLLLSNTAAYPENLNSSIVTTHMTIEPTISVQAQTTCIHQEISGTGNIEVTALFSVAANTKQVAMFVEATPFYMSGETENPLTEPITLDESAGVDLDPEDTEIVGNSTQVDYVADGNPAEGYPSRRTDLISFQSNELVFNKPTSVTARWIQDDPNRTAGTYQARIKLTCIAQIPE